MDFKLHLVFTFGVDLDNTLRLKHQIVLGYPTQIHFLLLMKLNASFIFGYLLMIGL